MSRRYRRVVRRPLPVVLAPLIVAAGVLTGCGTGSDAPQDAGVADFCDAATALDGEENSGAERAHEVGEELDRVGTPEGISEQAREGYEIQVDLLTSSGEDGAAERDLSDDELNLLTAYSEFVSGTCTS